MDQTAGEEKDAAMARRNGVKFNIAQLEQILDERRTELNRLHKERNSLQKQIDEVEDRITQLEGGMGGRGRRPRNERNLLDTLEAVLQDAGHPLRVPEIGDAGTETGYRSSSANFRGIVNQTLIKDKRFTATQRGVYTLKSAVKK
jgi:septal ring factor EnvC (AmiA/AmiB activator)